MNPSWSHLIQQATTSLQAAGVPHARYDAYELASHLTALTQGSLKAAIITGAVKPSARQQREYEGLVARRANREPLQHITGRAHFRDLTLNVGPGVFIPRPETEQVVQQAIDTVNAAFGSQTPLVIADLCTGSGAIALALASELPHAQVWAVELDSQAIAWTQRNIADQPDDIAQRVHLTHADARTALTQLDGTCHLVISNPPYIPPHAIPRDPEVQQYDPPVALYGLGSNGLAVPRGIVAAATRLVRPGGMFVMEHAEVQASAVRSLLSEDSWQDVATKPDLAGRDRMVVARRRADHPRVAASDTLATTKVNTPTVDEDSNGH